MPRLYVKAGWLLPLSAHQKSELATHPLDPGPTAIVWAAPRDDPRMKTSRELFESKQYKVAAALVVPAADDCAFVLVFRGRISLNLDRVFAKVRSSPVEHMTVPEGGGFVRFNGDVLEKPSKLADLALTWFHQQRIIRPQP